MVDSQRDAGEKSPLSQCKLIGDMSFLHDIVQALKTTYLTQAMKKWNFRQRHCKVVDPYFISTVTFPEFNQSHSKI